MATELVHRTANLFVSDESLAHCVSADFKMRAGIAQRFARIFGCRDELLAQRAGVGDVAFLQEDDRYIYYLVTKERYFQKPTYDDIRRSLQRLAKLCREHGVDRLSIPRLACGLDGKDWSQVEAIVRDTVVKAGVTVTVHVISGRLDHNGQRRVLDHK